jgi:hypothetical protein
MPSHQAFGDRTPRRQEASPTMISPIFKLDTDEKWRPQPVETAERFAVIAGTSKHVDLAHLPAGGGRMDFPSGLKDPTTTPLVGYHRVVPAANLWWHQFWLWYLDNPWDVLGVGRHEGDWEFVQIGCADEAGDAPVLITASQHHGGQKREFWRSEIEGGRPVIYVAVDSHANYFTAGDHDEIDSADGHGRVLADIEWRVFADAWALWPGLWGNSTGVARSPDSPGRQVIRWKRPEVFHAQGH